MSSGGGGNIRLLGLQAKMIRRQYSYTQTARENMTLNHVVRACDERERVAVVAISRMNLIHPTSAVIHALKAPKLHWPALRVIASNFAPTNVGPGLVGT